MPPTPASFDEPLAAELAALEEEYLAIEEAVLDLTDALSDEQLRWRPPSGGWSIVECLDHLGVAGYELLPRLDRAIADGQQRGLRREGPLRLRWRARWAKRWMEPSARFRVPAPKLFQPCWPDRPRQAVNEVAELQGELIKRLHEMNGLDLAALSIASPAAGWLKLTMGEWMVMTAAHERRHLWQAEQVREHEEFPTG